VVWAGRCRPFLRDRKMNAAQSKKLATLAIGSIVVMGAGRQLVVDGEFPPFKFWVAVGVTGFALSAVTDIEPTIGGGIAILIATVVFMEAGVPLMQRLAGDDRRTKRIKDKSTRRLVRQLTVKR